MCKCQRPYSVSVTSVWWTWSSDAIEIKITGILLVRNLIANVENKSISNHTRQGDGERERWFLKFALLSKNISILTLIRHGRATNGCILEDQQAGKVTSNDAFKGNKINIEGKFDCMRTYARKYITESRYRISANRWPLLYKDNGPKVRRICIPRITAKAQRNVSNTIIGTQNMCKFWNVVLLATQKRPSCILTAEADGWRQNRMIKMSLRISE